MQTLGVEINGSHIHSVTVDTRTSPRLDCGRVEVRWSMPQNRQLVLQEDASIVNECPRCKILLRSHVRLIYTSKYFAHISYTMCEMLCFCAIMTRCIYYCVTGPVILELKQSPRDYLRKYLEFSSFQSKSSLLFTYYGFRKFIFL